MILCGYSVYIGGGSKLKVGGGEPLVLYESGGGGGTISFV